MQVYKHIRYLFSVNYDHPMRLRTNYITYDIQFPVFRRDKNLLRIRDATVYKSFVYIIRAQLQTAK